MSQQDPTLPLSDAEWRVMNAVWRRHPATVRDVHEALEGETSWTYSTVKTLLGRLVEKGALAVTKRANTSVFEPRVSAGSARRQALRSLLDRAFGGGLGALVHHLVAEEQLDERDRQELAALLEREGLADRGEPRE